MSCQCSTVFSETSGGISDQKKSEDTREKLLNNNIRDIFEYRN